MQLQYLNHVVKLSPSLPRKEYKTNLNNLELKKNKNKYMCTCVINMTKIFWGIDIFIGILMFIFFFILCILMDNAQ